MSEREQVWRERIEWQQRSGLTVAECCEAVGVSVASFYRWKKLLTEAQGVRQPRSMRRSTQRTGVRASDPGNGASQFVPIALRDSSARHSPRQSVVPDHGSSLKLELPNGVVIHVAGDLDSQRLGDLIIAAGQIRTVPAEMTAGELSQHEVFSC